MTTTLKEATADGMETAKPVNPELERAFNGQILKTPPEASTRLVILARTLLAMLIPALYFAMLGVVAYYTFYHALFGLYFNQGAIFPVAAGLYVLPLISGSCLIALLLRPFFPLTHPHEHRLKLHQNDAADLPQLISLIQQKLNTDFDIDIEVSMLATVEIEANTLDLKKRRSLTLVLGLPLIKAMTTQQLCALICHELAHQANPSYRRAFNWTMSVDSWFDDCVKGHDGWKAYFARLEQTEDNSIYVVAGIIGKAAIICSDFVLGYLQVAFQSLSQETVKRLDRDADQSAVLLTGSQGFIESLQQLEVTNKAWQYTQSRLLDTSQSTLTDNLADEIAINSNAEGTLESESAKPVLPVSWNYHQASARIEYAKYEEIAGIFRLQTPASKLFKNFSALCKSVTPLYYRECGIEFSLKSLKPVAMNVKKQAAEDRYKQIIDDYTSETFSPTIVWKAGDTASLASQDTAEICQKLNKNIQQFRNQLPVYQDAITHNSNVQKEVFSHKLLQLRLKHGYITQENLAHRTENYKKQKAKLAQYKEIFTSYSSEIGFRLDAALSLGTEKSSPSETQNLLSYLQSLHSIHQSITSGEQLSALISGLLTHMYSNQEIKLKAELDTYTKSLSDVNRYIRLVLNKLPGDLISVDSISGYLREQANHRIPPGRDAAGKAVDFFTILKEEFCSLNIIVTGHLVERAIQNEAANNIEPVRLVLKPQWDKSA